jgi:1-deoxyxylulose-5-phosphate synthase
VSAPSADSASPCTIGLGAATFGREIDELAARMLLDYAFERGVVHFDTAAAYGAGASELVLGRWLADRSPAGVRIATKVVPPFGPAALVESIEQSLSRLALPAVDVLYLHRWDDSIDEASLAVLEEQRTQGRVRSLGISNILPTRLRALLERQTELGFRPFEVLQCNQNFAVTELTPEMMAVCAAFRLEVITFSPLGAGFLTGKHRGGVAPGSRFELVPGHQAIYFNPAAQQRLERLLQVAALTQLDPAQLALAWALRRPSVTTVLVGGRERSHLEQAFAARALIDPSVLAALELWRLPC